MKMDQASFISYFLIAVFELYMLYGFGRDTLSEWKQAFKRCAAIHGLFVLLLALVNVMGNTTLKLAGVPLVYGLYVCCVFKDSIVKKLSVVFCFYMMMIGPECMFAMLNQVTQKAGSQSVEMTGVKFFIMMLVMKGMTFVLARCIGRICRSGLHQVRENRVLWKLLLLPATTIFFFLCIFYADVKVSGPSVVLLSTGIIFLLASNVYMFSVFDQLILANEKACRMELAGLQSRIERKNYMELEKINKKHQVLLHDFNKYLRTAAELIKEENYKEVYALFEKAGLRIREGGHHFITGNPLLNAVLAERRSQAVEWGITYKAKAEQNVNVDFMDELDMISILGNLIDNALEAACQGGDKKDVSVRMYMANHGNFFNVEIENNFQKAPVIKHNRFVTSKKNKNEHGIGFGVVKSLVQKYGGMIQTKTDKNRFYVFVSMPAQYNPISCKNGLEIDKNCRRC